MSKLKQILSSPTTWHVALALAQVAIALTVHNPRSLQIADTALSAAQAIDPTK